MIKVDVEPRVATRLNNASAARRWFPFDDAVVDWSVPFTADWAYMPAHYSSLAGAEWYQVLGVEDRAFVERWEVTQLLRNIAHGEHLLNQGILAMLWTVDPYDPSYRYLLHEVAEECQHMAMFNEWVRRNDDIVTVGSDEAAWGPAIGAYTAELAARLPEAFWVNVLLFEFVGDEFNAALKGGPEGQGSADGRPMHPTLVGIGTAHTAEEARHIGYARAWLREGAPGLDASQLAEVRSLAELGAQSIVDRQCFLPLRWTEQLAPYVDADAFRAGLGRSEGTTRMLRQLERLVVDFAELGVLGAERVRRWQDEGAFG